MNSQEKGEEFLDREIKYYIQSFKNKSPTGNGSIRHRSPRESLDLRKSNAETFKYIHKMNKLKKELE